MPFGANPEKGPKANPGANPEKDTKKRPKAPEEPHVRPAPITTMLPHGAAAKVPVVRSPPKSPSERPLSTPPSLPTSTLSPVVLGPVAMGIVEEIKNALIESNRVATMPIP